jgi:phosphopantothenoylcysteine decarboxylase/phosphopantothenate--cysteine ligase
MKILMLITGSISAHKTPSIVSALSIYNNHKVHIMTTKNALKFVTKDSLMYSAEKWWNDEYMAHIKAIDEVKIDKLVVVPATANIIGKIANGIADDEVSSTCIKCPSTITRIIFPAMNTDMWNNNIVQKNIETILSSGWCIVDPGYGKMACGCTGQGILPETRNLVECIEKIECQREIVINENLIYNGCWYSDFKNKKFRVIDSDLCNYYVKIRFGDDNNHFFYYSVDKKDSKLIYLTNLNRIIDYKKDLCKGYIKFEDV